MHFVYGFCNGNSRAAVAEYQRRFPDRRIPSRRVFTRIHQTLRDSGCFPSVSVSSVPRFCRLNNPCILVVMYALIRESVGRQSDKPCDVTAQHSSVMYGTSNPMYNYYTNARNLHFKLMVLCHSQVTLMLSTDINITETTYSCQFQYEFGNQ